VSCLSYVGEAQTLKISSVTRNAAGDMILTVHAYRYIAMTTETADDTSAPLPTCQRAAQIYGRLLKLAESVFTSGRCKFANSRATLYRIDREPNGRSRRGSTAVTLTSGAAIPGKYAIDMNDPNRMIIISISLEGHRRPVGSEKFTGTRSRDSQTNTLYNEATLIYRMGYRLIYVEVVVGQLRAVAIIQSSRTI